MARNNLQAGDSAPDFSIKDTRGANARLSDFKGKWVVLYFYPKDNTPGCTVEAIAFTKHLKDFQNMNAVILGVSPDSCQSHEKFVKDQKLKVTLLSDPDHSTLEAYGAWQLKENYGKKYWGVVRSTVLISPEGKIAHLWPKVKAEGHAEEVRDKLGELTRKQTVSA